MPKLKRITTTDQNFATQLAEVLNRDSAAERNVDQQVADIIQDVRQRGDGALLELTAKFDGNSAGSIAGLELSQERLQQASKNISKEKFAALTHAVKRVNTYHQHQKQSAWFYTEADGSRYGQKVLAMQRAGLYVPGGKAAYPSSVLMTAIPAKVAGVKELIMMVPAPLGELNEMVLAAAFLAGVDRVFTIGGAQAIAALAYGTETVPAVDTIVGPGNVYVASAKKQVFGKVGIDMIAGPSEVLVVADETTNPDWVAMDLFAQAEHDEMAQSILLTPDASYADKVQQSIKKLLPSMERQDIIAASLEKNGAIIITENIASLPDIIDQIAPEHLELMIKDAEALSEKVSNAGAIFIGSYSSESLGDYTAGPSHVLPTSGTARFSSPLGVYDFQKRTSIIHCSQEGAQVLGQVASTLARSESLSAHARSAEMRIEKIKVTE